MENCAKCKTGGFESDQVYYVWFPVKFRKKASQQLKPVCTFCYQELLINGELVRLNIGEPGETAVVLGGEIDVNP